MVYTINYSVWLIVCALILCLVFLLNIKQRWITSFLVFLIIFIMYSPNLFTTISRTVIDYNQVERNIQDAKLIDNGNMICFTGTNYTLEKNLEGLNEGFYDYVEILELKELKFNLFNDIIIKVYKSKTLKYIYVDTN